MAEKPNNPQSGEMPIDRTLRFEHLRADARTKLERLLDLYLLDVPAQAHHMSSGSRFYTNYRRPLDANRLIPWFEAYASTLVEIHRSETAASPDPNDIFSHVMETCGAINSRKEFEPLFETKEFRRRVLEACEGQNTAEKAAGHSSDPERLVANKGDVSVMIAAMYLDVTKDHVLRLIRDGTLAATNTKPKKISTESLRKYKQPSFRPNPT